VIRVMGQWEWHYEVCEGCQWNALYNVGGHQKIVWGVSGVSRKESQG